MPKKQVSDIFYITGWGGHLLGFGDIRTSGLHMLILFEHSQDSSPGLHNKKTQIHD